MFRKKKSYQLSPEEQATYQSLRTQADAIKKELPFSSPLDRKDSLLPRLEELYNQEAYSNRNILYQRLTALREKKIRENDIGNGLYFNLIVGIVSGALAALVLDWADAIAAPHANVPVLVAFMIPVCIGMGIASAFFLRHTLKTAFVKAPDPILAGEIDLLQKRLGL